MAEKKIKKVVIEYFSINGSVKGDKSIYNNVLTAQYFKDRLMKLTFSNGNINLVPIGSNVKRVEISE